jgi:alpha-D-ribose 1-methylphosphonate 5-triphosphate diphosphatase
MGPDQVGDSPDRGTDAAGTPLGTLDAGRRDVVIGMIHEADHAIAGCRMTPETVLTNAKLVLPEAVVCGTLVLRGASIAAAEPGRSALPGAVDLEGDFLIPGVVDVHTDNLERQVQPRNNARWPSRSAMVAHDVQCAAAGVTSVLDALCLGDLGFERGRIRTFREGVADLDALADTGLLKAEHFLHLRCELPAEDMLALAEPVLRHPRVRMVSLMDHSPGSGQYADLDRYRAMRRADGVPETDIDRHMTHMAEQRARLRGPNRRALLALTRGLAVALASHDDRTAEEIADNAADGIGISEFPVTMLAALAARAAAMQVIAGAPNIVRGGSHSGNVSAADLVREGAVDALASDYVPASLVEAAFRSVDETGITLPAAVAMVTDRPARMCGLGDRGRLAPGLRGDAVRVRVHDGQPIVRQVWRAGERVI